MKHPNRIKAAMSEGRLARGYNLTYPSPHVIEILAPFDFDFVWLDCEHGPFSLSDLEEHCRTAESVGVTPIARVPNIQSSTVLQFLGRGIQGIMGPHIATRADAEQLVKACLFGPQGERSFGGNRGCDYDFELQDKKAYYQQCNDNMIIIALLEDGDVKENLDEILSVSGIDYFSVGPNDFAQGIGYPGEPGRKEVLDAIDAIHDRIRGAGQRVGIDVVRTEWVKAMLIDSARRFIESS